MFDRSLWMVLTIFLITADFDGAAQEPEPKSPEKARLELMSRAFSTFDLQFADRTDKPLSRTPKPLLRWSNPVRNTFSDGAFFLWLDDARPVAIATISIRGTGAAWREFSTLAERPLQATQEGQVVWNPNPGDLVLKPLKDGPIPVQLERLRLTQMRKLATQFQITMYESEKNREESKILRLLPQPVYQWMSKSPAVSQGAVFAFCETTDPEAILVLELFAERAGDQPAWRYSLTRQTSRPLTFTYQGEELGSVNGYWGNPRTKQDPYIETRMPQFDSNE